MEVIQIEEEDSGYREVADAFLKCKTIVVHGISFCKYRLWSNVEDHSNVDTSNTFLKDIWLQSHLPRGIHVEGLYSEVKVVSRIIRRFRYTCILFPYVVSYVSHMHGSQRRCIWILLMYFPMKALSCGDRSLVRFDELLDEPETPVRKGGSQKVA